MEFGALVNSSNDAMVVIDHEDTIKLWNVAATRMFGWTSEEISGRKVTEIIPPQFRKAHEDGRARATNGEFRILGKTVEVMGLHKTGREFPIELTISTWRDGESPLFAGIVRDITARKQAEQERLAAEARFRSITESSNDAVISVSRDNRIISWNSGAEKMFGHTAAEIVGREVNAIIPERFRRMHDEGFRRFLASGERHIIGKTVEVAGVHKDGREFPIELTLSTWDEHGTPFFAGIIRDITARKRVERELEDEKRRLAIERDRSDRLLLNILPAKVAAELRNRGKVTAKLYPEVTVVFADFVDFSLIASRVSATELVEQLDAFFYTFDQITEKYGLEKIKTIGDSYMCAAGVPDEDAGCVVSAILAAKEMIDAVRGAAGRDTHGCEWKLRVGVSSGPVVAGVVGSKRLAFDIWGDTVNLASRIEAAGIPGEVCASGNAVAQVEKLFEFTHQGVISLKNMGEHSVYVVGHVKRNPGLFGSSVAPSGACDLRAACHLAMGCKRSTCSIRRGSAERAE